MPVVVAYGSGAIAAVAVPLPVATVAAAIAAATHARTFIFPSVTPDAGSPMLPQATSPRQPSAGGSAAHQLIETPGRTIVLLADLVAEQSPLSVLNRFNVPLTTALFPPFGIVPVSVPTYRHVPKSVVNSLPVLTVTAPLFIDTVSALFNLAAEMTPLQAAMKLEIVRLAPSAFPVPDAAMLENEHDDAPNADVVEIDPVPELVEYGSGDIEADAGPAVAAADAAAIAATTRPRLRMNI
ncbi:hypothetical protein [Conexibacter woesei]|uniref:hypothetical protein n=1 Tax=Conexibacter woesei TaxID=191495 RepID=UPI0011D2C0B9|nr:hypothetical protein [Conexibacter woesei]